MVLRKLLHWLLPLTCYYCGHDLPEADPGPLCALCLLGVRPPAGLRCKRCDLKLDFGGGHCRECKRFVYGGHYSPLTSIRAASEYSPEVRKVIRECKYEGRRELATAMGAWLYGIYDKAEAPDALVPVPLHSLRLRERGFNQALVMAEELSRLCGVPVRDVLTRVRATEANYTLGKDDRRKNLAGAFSAATGAGLAGGRVLLIDDVATTGATLTACASALKRVGVGRIDALVVARKA